MIKSTLSIALLLALAVPTAAQVTPDPAPERFDAADTNDDGKVDRTEYDGFVAELVLLYDTDRDGKISRDEAATARDPTKFDAIDGNRDGYLAHGEVDGYTDNDFAAMDDNSDGAIDREEAKRHP